MRREPAGLLLLSGLLGSPALAQEPVDEFVARVEAMARVGAAWAPSFSPDGERIAFLTRLSGSPQVWIVSSDGGWPEQVTALDDPVGGVQWSPDGQWLAIQVAPGGGLNEQVHLVRPDGTGLQQVTEGGRVNNWLGDWTHDRRYLTLASNRRGVGMDAYLYDLAAGELRLVAENPGVGVLTDVSRDGRRAILFRLQSRGSNDLFLLDLERHTEILLTPHEGPGTFSGGRFGPEGDVVYLGSNKDRDKVAFARVRIDGRGRPRPIEVLAAREDAELAGFDLTEDGRTAALVWNADGRSELAFIDLASGRVTPGPPPPAEVIGGLVFSRDGARLAMTLSGAAAPTDIWILDRPGTRFRQVTRSPHPGVDLPALVRPELVRYTAHDGLPLSGWLYRPAGFRVPGPVVLSFHGGPEGQEVPAFRSDYQALLAYGIAVFAPNVRGSAGFGKRFVNLDNGALRVNAVRDIRTSAEHVIGMGVADPARIGVMGGSYGGYMVVAGLTEYPDLFAAGANLFGVVNFETFFANTEPWMAAISTVEYGDPKSELGLLRRLSPIHRVDRVRAPTIVLHGANDTNVPVVEAEQVVESLRARGVPVEYVLFPDEGHGWRKTPNRIRSTVEVVRWFSTHLKASAPGER